MRDKAFVNRNKRDEFNFSEANSEKLSATKFAASSSLLPGIRLPAKNDSRIHRFCSYRGNIRRPLHFSWFSFTIKNPARVNTRAATLP